MPGNLFPSDELGGLRQAEKFEFTESNITGLRWWGTTQGLSGQFCNRAPQEFEITFYEDANNAPGNQISQNLDRHSDADRLHGL